MAVATCGGPVIPFRAGRIDVWSAQSSNNTPIPEDDIATLRESFRKQGFSAAEMITLTACGHTMGGVRSTDFPQLVPPDTTSSVPVIKNFDTTTNFDNAVYVNCYSILAWMVIVDDIFLSDSVTEYLSGTTQNVLVVTSNATMASDLRIFSSDNNSTMKRFGKVFNLLSIANCSDIIVLLIRPPLWQSASHCWDECLIQWLPTSL